MTMEKNMLKKLGVVAITAVIIVLFLALPVFYFVVEVPTIAIVFAAMIYMAMAVLMVYYVVERLREIDEGLDYVIDDY